MNLRHEWKHEITPSDVYELRMRLSAVMQRDEHAPHGYYTIRSLYFDDLFDTALREKIDGVNHRVKFRLRYYNGDFTRILLEKKTKVNGLCGKEQQLLSAAQAQWLIDGNDALISGNLPPLLQEFERKRQTHGLKAQTIVDYTREPFVFAPGNVRVTIDRRIRTGLHGIDFLNPDAITIPLPDDPIILEVKWDDYLPNIVRDIVQLNGCRTSAFSKYAACRMME